jgi:hypothetical protein
LNYTNPVSGTYQLMRNPALSTPSHLVLELVGPAATTGRGVVFSLTVDTAKVSWSNVAPADPPGTYVQNGTAFDLGTGGQVLKGKVNGEELQAVAAQKGAASPSVQLNQPLARIAMDLKPSQNLWAGTPITFTAIPGKSLALLGPAGSPQAIQIAVGSLTAK